MHFNYLTSTINFAFLGIHAFILATAAVLIYIKHHHPKDRAWKYIFVFFLSSACSSVAEILNIVTHTAPLDAYELLNPAIIVPGFFIYSLLLCYILEVQRPYWMNWKRWFIIFSPIIVFSIVLIVLTAQGKVSEIYSISRLIDTIHLPDVWLRVAFMLLYWPYTIGLLYARHHWHTPPRLRRQLQWVVALTILLCFTYIGSRGLQFFPAYVADQTLYFALAFMVVYIEHYERLHLPMERVRKYYNLPAQELPTHQEESIQAIVDKLSELMDNPVVWQNPEITRDEIIRRVGTNRTYIQTAAKAMGFASLSDILHHKRIDHVCQCLRKDPTANIQDLFYDAGYRSRTTAWRHFVQIVGMTPTEFIERTTPPPKGNSK